MNGGGSEGIMSTMHYKIG